MDTHTEYFRYLVCLSTILHDDTFFVTCFFIKKCFVIIQTGFDLRICCCHRACSKNGGFEKWNKEKRKAIEMHRFLNCTMSLFCTLSSGCSRHSKIGSCSAETFYSLEQRMFLVLEFHRQDYISVVRRRSLWRKFDVVNGPKRGTINALSVRKFWTDCECYW